MTPRERLIRTIRGERADRVGLNMLSLNPTDREQLERAADLNRREIASRIYDHTHYTVQCTPPHSRWLMTPPQSIHQARCEEIDGKVTVTHRIDTPAGPLTAVTQRRPETNTTWTVKYPVESLADLDRLRRAPWRRPEWSPPPRDEWGADFDTRGVVAMHTSSPFVCVAGAMPYQMFLELCATDVALIESLTAQCAERVMDVLEMALASGVVEYVWLGGCEWLTPPMGSPALYDRLVQPFERRIIDRVHRAGAVCHLHCHGRVRSTLERIIDRGADCTEPVEPPPDGDLPFAEAKRIAGGRITLGGNVECRILENESPDAVESAVRAAFDGGRDRMILQPTEGPVGGVSDRLLANYHRMVDVWEQMSAL